MDKSSYLITEEEISIAEKCIDAAKRKGATAVRITLDKSTMDTVALLDGEVDRISHSADKALTVQIFADERFGSFSTNRLDEKNLMDFISKAVETVKMLAKDVYRKLPPQERVAKNAVTGREMGLFDEKYFEFTPSARRAVALDSSFIRKEDSYGYNIVSEEAEYSDSVSDTVLIDSDGTFCRHSETSFEMGCETTVQDSEGNRYSSYWWEASPNVASFRSGDVCRRAAQRAAAQISPHRHEVGRFNLIVENEVASRLVTPLLSALSAYSLQQKNSFLDGSLGKRIFSEGFTLMDRPDVEGASGSKLFDSEGVAAKASAVIEKGIVKRYSVNTYMSGKTGFEPTVEEVIRPVVLPWKEGGATEAGISLEDIIRLCGDGILVTGFNGGNSNSSTGDFSYGIEGFEVKGGKRGGPVKSMVITGNFITLWNNLIAAGSDFRSCSSRSVPSLAFKDVDFSA